MWGNDLSSKSDPHPSISRDTTVRRDNTKHRNQTTGTLRNTITALQTHHSDCKMTNAIACQLQNASPSSAREVWPMRTLRQSLFQLQHHSPYVPFGHRLAHDTRQSVGHSGQCHPLGWALAVDHDLQTQPRPADLKYKPVISRGVCLLESEAGMFVSGELPKLTALLYSGSLPDDGSEVAMETARTYRGGGDAFYH